MANGGLEVEFENKNGKTKTTKTNTLNLIATPMCIMRKEVLHKQGRC